MTPYRYIAAVAFTIIAARILAAVEVPRSDKNEHQQPAFPGNGDRDNDGYTNLEEYLNSLVSRIE